MARTQKRERETDLLRKKGENRTGEDKWEVQSSSTVTESLQKDTSGTKRVLRNEKR